MTRSSRPIRNAARSLPTALALAAVAGAAHSAAARTAAAQAATPAGADARWQAWYGCWAAVPDTSAAAAAADGGVTCVTPAGGAAVELTTVARGRVTSRDTVDAGGARREFVRDGCGGWERGEWSADGRRVYLSTELSCANNVRRTGEGVLAFARGGEWLDVRAATVGGYTGVRARRYRPAAAPAGLPADVASRVAGATAGVETARLAAAAPARPNDVLDVTRHAGAPVAAAWVAELGQRFALDARQLAALADAGVPGQVTDVLVATAYPRRFALGPSGAERAVAASRDDRALGRPGPVAVLAPVYGGWGWSAFGLSPFGFSPYGLGYGYGLGSGLGYYPGSGYWGRGPIVVVRPGANEQATQRGRVVPGRGYTRDDGFGSSGSARPTGGSSWSGSSSASGGGSSGGSSSGGSSAGSSSSGGGRTAKPRP